MARRSLLLLCWPPGPGRPLGDSVLPGECSRRLRCGAGHPRGCGEGLAPRGAGLPCAGDPALLAAAATGAAPAPTPRDEQSPCTSGPVLVCPPWPERELLLRRAEAAVETSAGRSWLWPCWCGVVPGQTPSSSRARVTRPWCPRVPWAARASSSAWERTDPPTGGPPTLAGHSCPPSAPVGLEGGHEWLCPPILMHTPPGSVSREPVLQGRHGNPHWHLPLAVGLLVTLATCTLLLAFGVQSVLSNSCFEFCNFVVF